jgi:integrase
VERLQLLGRKRSTLMDYESTLRAQLVPFFGDQPIASITPPPDRALPDGQAPGRPCTEEHPDDLGLLYGVLGLAEKRGWIVSNPCKHVELPRAGTHDDGDIRYLSPEEVEALCRAVPGDDLGRVERLMYRTAAMTGLRQGELLALRWREVDWVSGASESAAALSAASSAPRNRNRPLRQERHVPLTLRRRMTSLHRQQPVAPDARSASSIASVLRSRCLIWSAPALGFSLLQFSFIDIHPLWPTRSTLHQL